MVDKSISLILKENREEMIVGHGMVGEDTQGDYEHSHTFCKDFTRIRSRKGFPIWPDIPFLILVHVNLVESAI